MSVAEHMKPRCFVRGECELLWLAKKARCGSHDAPRQISVLRDGRQQTQAVAISPSAEKRRILVEAYIGGSAFTRGLRREVLRSPP